MLSQRRAVNRYSYATRAKQHTNETASFAHQIACFVEACQTIHCCNLHLRSGGIPKAGKPKDFQSLPNLHIVSKAWPTCFPSEEVPCSQASTLRFVNSVHPCCTAGRSRGLSHLGRRTECSYGATKLRA
eukprot:3206442-Amphidinium_carterae.1